MWAEFGPSRKNDYAFFSTKKKFFFCSKSSKKRFGSITFLTDLGGGGGGGGPLWILNWDTPWTPPQKNKCSKTFFSQFWAKKNFFFGTKFFFWTSSFFWVKKLKSLLLKEMYFEYVNILQYMNIFGYFC